MVNYQAQVQRLIGELSKKKQEYLRGNELRSLGRCHWAIQQLVIWQERGFKGSPPDLSGFGLTIILELENSETGAEVLQPPIEPAFVEFEPAPEIPEAPPAAIHVPGETIQESYPIETLAEMPSIEFTAPVSEALLKAPALETPEERASDETAIFPIVEQTALQPEPVLARIDRSLLENYVKEAFDAYDDGDFELCLARLQLVLENDLDYPDIHEKVTDATRKLREKRARLKTDRLKVELPNAVDISDLDCVTNQTQAIIDEGFGDDQLRNLYADAIRRRDEKRRIQRTLISTLSLRKLEIVNEAINVMALAMYKGERYWADDRYSGSYRSINDVIDELRSLRVSLAKDVCNRIQKKAESFMPANPRSAVVLLQDAISLEGLEESVRQEAEKQLREAELAESRWKQADTLVTEALTSTTDPFVQFQRIQEADDIYPAHLGIAPAQDAVIRVVAALLTGEIRRAITESESRLADEDFAGARQVIFLVQSRAEKISPHPQDLQDAIQESRAMLERVAVSEKRRRQISEQAGVIREQLSRGDVALARQVFLDLPEDWQTDQMMNSLRKEIDDAIFVDRSNERNSHL